VDPEFLKGAQSFQAINVQVTLNRKMKKYKKIRD
jgi:hypothetical protein